MAVIDICSTPNVIVTSGEIGFRFNPEMNLQMPAQLFDAIGNVDDVAIYRVHPQRVLYKGIVRKVRRNLIGESLSLQVAAAETVLEQKRWTPTYAAYNVDILCRNRLLNATIGDVIAAEYTNHEPPDGEQGPKDWFTAVELPASIASLVAGPVETYQSSFLSIVEAAIAIHANVQWYIEYDEVSTDILPLGRLVFVDTIVGRNPYVATLGGAGPTVATADIEEDYTQCAAKILVYGGGDFVEKDEVLLPAWKPEDESLDRELVFPAPSQEQLEAPEVPITYIPWGYDLVSVDLITASIGGVDVPLFYGADFWINMDHGTVLWNRVDCSVRKNGIAAPGEIGILINGDPPSTDWRKVAVNLDGFADCQITMTIRYSGPDCYRLYHVSEPIADVRYRVVKVKAPDSDSLIDEAALVDTTIEAFGPNRIADESKYVADPEKYLLAKVFIPEEDGIYWDERNPQFASAKGYSIPLDSPEYEPGRTCVRFEQRQIAPLYVPVWTEINPEEPEKSKLIYVTWQIKLRYTAWRNLVEERVGITGAEYEARFVFDELRKFTMFDGTVILDKSADLVKMADDVQTFYGNVQWTGAMELAAVKSVSGPYKVTTLPLGLGDAVTLTGNVGPAVATSFLGIVNSISLTGLESSLVQISMGPREPTRNPFAPKPPTFTDQDLRSRIVYDRSIFDRRST